ncbi:hypothetical protein KQX64_24400 [Rhodopseudomonas palustris]|nr:hypothetical protein KQX64_24400 [Rhodopseudomonas palustris]
MTEDARNSFANLILLCRIHHKIVDDNEALYSADVLRQLKKDHDEKIRNLSSEDDRRKLRSREECSLLISSWEQRAKIAEWDRWANNIIDTYPRITFEDEESLSGVSEWTISRWWPDDFPLIKASIVNFSAWLQITLSVLYRHAEAQDREYFTPKFYKINDWDKEKYDSLAEIWNKHLELLSDIMIELCKSANLVASQVRSQLSPAYRQLEGKFSLQVPSFDPHPTRTTVFEYSAAEIGDGLIFARTSLYRELAKSVYGWS